MAAMEAWEKHLRKVLKFPFKAFVAEFQDRGPLQGGDKVTVRKIVAVDERYGVLVEIQSRQGVLIFPFCDLEAADLKSPNHDKLLAYVVWYATAKSLSGHWELRELTSRCGFPYRTDK